MKENIGNNKEKILDTKRLLEMRIELEKNNMNKKMKIGIKRRIMLLYMHT